MGQHKWLEGWHSRKKMTILGSKDGPFDRYQLKVAVHRCFDCLNPIAVKIAAKLAESGINISVQDIIDLLTPRDSGNNVYLASPVRPKYEDVRFVGINNDLLNYWIEESNRKSALLWVDFINLKESPAENYFYIYYNNSRAWPYSSGKMTFPIFHTRDEMLGLLRRFMIDIFDFDPEMEA